MNYLCSHLSLFGIFASIPLTVLTFVTTRPLKSKLLWLSLLQKLTVLTFCHDSAIEEQALMALAASKVET